MLWLYRLLLPLGVLLTAPFYLLRMRRRGGYGERFGDRFGGLPPLPAKRPGVTRYWIQAVSVGEMLGIEPLVRRLLARGDAEVFLTTTTSTGYALAREKYAAAVLDVAYFPLDWWPCSARAWRRVRADVAVLMESELWPEHLRQARAHGARVVLVNARMSDRSFRRMLRVRPLARWLVRAPDLVLAGSVRDRRRFVEIGADPERCRATGNLKLDVPVEPVLAPCDRLDLRDELGLGDAPLLVGASTWPGEEEALLASLRTLRAAGRQCHLLLVPRHAERREEIRRAVEAAGWTYHLRSRGVAPGPVDVAIGDTTGELRRLVQLADLVFVGKSLPPHDGGQTPIEAAAFGKAILFGPHMTNFRVAARELVEAGAAEVVPDAAALTRRAAELLPDTALCAARGEAGRLWHTANRGALDRTITGLTGG